LLFGSSITLPDAVQVCVLIANALEHIGYVASESALLARSSLEQQGFEAFFRLSDLKASTLAGRSRAPITYRYSV